jgi:hypothetical protein
MVEDPVQPPGQLVSLLRRERSEEDRARLTMLERNVAEPADSRVLHFTRSQTLAYALADSPVARLAWIAEKFVQWANPARPIAVDRLLTNVILYWLTGTTRSSSGLHDESGGRRGGPQPCPVPLGVAVFPHGLVLPVRRLAERRYTTLRWTEFDRGGHFAAIEAPALLAGDVRTFFRHLP